MLFTTGRPDWHDRIRSDHRRPFCRPAIPRSSRPMDTDHSFPNERRSPRWGCRSHRLGFDYPRSGAHARRARSRELMFEGDLLFQNGEPMRFAVPRTLDVTETDGQWIEVPGGRIWRIEIGAVDAENSSVIMQGVDMPEGAELRTYVPGHPESVWGPFTDDGPMDDGRIQSMTEPASSVMIEYFEPDSAFGTGLPFHPEDYMQATCRSSA